MIREMTVRGIFAENCYFYIDDISGAGFIIDPGAEPAKIYDAVISNNWHIEKILLTHGHFDHMGAVEFLSNKLAVPYYVYPADDRYLTDPVLNLSGNYGLDMILPHPDFIEDGETIRLAANSQHYLKVIHTPGHTPGSVTYYAPNDNAAFVGDTLYEHGPGLTNFPGGNRRELEESIVNKILTLPDSTVLLSGHSSPITVAEEKRLLLQR